MANFRTTADLLDGVLRRCGELTSDAGVSPRKEAALLYLNQIHYTLVNGGNELNIDIDEPWIWARARSPIIIQILPSITSGTVSLTQGANNGLFNAPPLVNGAQFSLRGWHIRPQGFPEIYKIASHTAGTNSFTLDADYPQVTNSALNFTAFQIDYPLQNTAIIIDPFNNVFDFSEDGNTTRTVMLGLGSYEPSALATSVATQMTVQSGIKNTYTGTFDYTNRRFTFSTDSKHGGTFWIQGATPNSFKSGWATLGFDYTTLTGATSYTSAYSQDTIVRLSQPARTYYGTQFTYGMGTGTIGNIDVVAFDRQYPLIDLKVGTPNHFTVIEDQVYGEGSNLTVRFNKYLSSTQNMRVEFDHIPQPRDLFNNQYSIPLLPRKFAKILEFGASYYLCVDKEDSRQDKYLGLSQQALNAMKKANRREMERSGTDFGQVFARPDLMSDKRRTLRINDYGYTASF